MRLLISGSWVRAPRWAMQLVRWGIEHKNAQILVLLKLKWFVMQGNIRYISQVSYASIKHLLLIHIYCFGLSPAICLDNKGKPGSKTGRHLLDLLAKELSNKVMACLVHESCGHSCFGQNFLWNLIISSDIGCLGTKCWTSHDTYVLSCEL